MRTLSRWTLILAAALLAGPARAEPPAKKKAPVIAIFNTDDRNTGLERAELDMLSDDLTAGVERALAGYEVVAPRALKRALVEALKGKFDACYDKLCQFSLGKEVDADYVLSSTLSRVGKGLLTAVIWNVERKVSVVTATAKGGCDREALIGSVGRAAGKFKAKLRPSPTGKNAAP